MTTASKIVRPGLFDTVQDFGRIGFMALGMPTAGATDRGEVGHYYVTFPNPDVTLTFDQHLFHLARQQVDGA